MGAIVEMQKELGLSQRPGFDMQALETVCAQECDRAEPVDPDRFGREVCGRGGR